MLSFSIRAFNVFIIVTLNSLSYNSTIYVIVESVSDGLMVSSDDVFVFLS